MPLDQIGGVYQITQVADFAEIDNDLAGEYNVEKKVYDFTYDTQDPAGQFYNGGNGWKKLADFFVSATSSVAQFTGIIHGNGAVIKGLKSVATTSDNYSGGGFIRSCGGTAQINDLFFDGCDLDVTASGSSDNAGMLCANITDTAQINRCAVINSAIDSAGPRTGGVVGWAKDDSQINNCRSIGNTIVGTDYVGGIFGLAGGGLFSYDKCVATSSVSSTTGSSAVGAIGGETWNGTESNCFYLDSLPAGTGNNRGTAKTQAELQDINTYTDVDNTTGLDEAYSIATLSAYVDETWAIDDGNAYPILGLEIEDAALPEGEITYPDGTIFSGVWDRFKASSETQGVPTLIESGTIVDGAYDGVTTERDDTQVEFFVVRGLSNEFTGTISSVSGTGNVEVDVSPTDLSEASIGGSGDDHWIFRATDGTSADEEVTVLSRSGNVLTLKSNPGFSAGDAFVLGKVIKNVSNILPKG